MTFNATTPRISLTIIFVLLLLSLLIGTSEGFLFNFNIFVLNIILLSFVFIALFIRYKFVIEESRLTYQILLVNIPIFTRTLQPKDIQNVNFKRVGWAKKDAIIKPIKGMSLRIIDFPSDDVYIKLNEFVIVHDISIFKTKDYQNVEKLLIRSEDF